MTDTNAELLERLQKASDGLQFMSESEAPFNTVLWKSGDNSSLNPETILRNTGHSQDTPIEVVDLDTFFGVATTEQDWYGPEECEMVKRFQNLVEILKQHLVDLRVYRVGHRNIDAYIVGKSLTGDYAGLSTKVVET
jgi:hypothetical protein